jgi:hypothetical protein
VFGAAARARLRNATNALASSLASSVTLVSDNPTLTILRAVMAGGGGLRRALNSHDDRKDPIRAQGLVQPVGPAP